MSIIYNKLRCVGDWDVGDVPAGFEDCFWVIWA